MTLPFKKLSFNRRKEKFDVKLNIGFFKNNSPRYLSTYPFSYNIHVFNFAERDHSSHGFSLFLSPSLPPSSFLSFHPSFLSSLSLSSFCPSLSFFLFFFLFLPSSLPSFLSPSFSLLLSFLLSFLSWFFFLFILFYFYLFIFGCVGSSLLRAGFL